MRGESLNLSSRPESVRALAPSASDPNPHSSHWASFVEEIDELGKSIRQSDGIEDFRQFRKMEFWGRCASLLGYATAWIAPNPVSALLISHGNFARWSLVLHPVSHGAFDRSRAVPSRYKSHRFAHGLRRFLDWFDWITPESWSEEHNHLHHYYLGSPKDPDVVGRNAAMIRELRAPAAIRYLLAIILACVWKPTYYAVNTLAESRHQSGLLPSNRLGWNNWSPMTAEGRELWTRCLLPYATFRFVLVPALFLPLGQAAALNVLMNSIIAELLTNLYSFIMIGPNHTGDDLYTFAHASQGKADHYLRQIIGTVNYPSGGDVNDFIYGGMNYQIEHHLWPAASIFQYRRVRPKLREICARYQIPYHEAPVSLRFLKTLKILAGTSQQLEQPLHESSV